jgi:hypothetical protein
MILVSSRCCLRTSFVDEPDFLINPAVDSELAVLGKGFPTMGIRLKVSFGWG